MRSIAGKLLCLWILILMAMAMAMAADEGQPVLVPGKAIERALAADESHEYPIALNAGQLLHLVVNERGVDIRVSLLNSAGEVLIKVASPPNNVGSESLYFIAKAADIYRVKIYSTNQVFEGPYQIIVKEVRAAVAADELRVNATRLFSEAIDLFTQYTADGLAKSIEKLQEVARVSQQCGDQLREADAIGAIGQAYFVQRQPDKANEYYEQALKLRRAAGDIDGEAALLLLQIIAHQQTRDVPRIVEVCEQAVEIFNKTGYRVGQAFLYNRMGIIYFEKSELRKALEVYDKALALREQLGLREGAAEVLNNMGVACNLSGDYEKALEHYRKAFELTRNLENLRDKELPAVMLNNIGLLYEAMGEHQQAIDNLDQALLLHRKLGNRLSEASALNNIGLIHASLGNKERALEYYQRSLAIAEELKQPQIQAPILKNIGVIQQELGDLRGAQSTLERAMARARDVGNRVLECSVGAALGKVYSLADARPQALETLTKALELARAGGYRTEEGDVLSALGTYYTGLGEHEKALDCYNQALLLRRQVGDPRKEGAVLFRLALTKRSLNRIEEALPDAEAAIDNTESLRARIIGKDLRATFLSFLREYYDLYLDLLMQMHERVPDGGHDAKAFNLAERARARVLLEMLTEARIDVRAGVDAGILEREAALQRQLNIKADYQRRLSLRKASPEQLSALAREIDQLTNEYQDIQAQIRAKSPNYAALTQPQPLTVTEIQAQLLDADTILLEYSCSAESCYLWVISKEGMKSYRLGSTEQIEAVARRFYELITARQAKAQESARQHQQRIAQADAQLDAQARQLSALLLGPAAAQLDKKRLLIVPDGILQYLPFAALPAPQQASPLIVDHEVIYLASASTIAVMRREFGARARAAKALAVFADPVFDSDDQRVKAAQVAAGGSAKGKAQNSAQNSYEQSGLLRSAIEANAVNEGQPLGRLLLSRQEAIEIAALVKDDERNTALGFEASRAAALSPELAQYRIIHFATHSLLNSVHPELSGIVLSLVDENGLSQDGFLRLHDIYKMRLPADLVVLSACQTGLGKKVKGEGLIGLTRGFMYAGTERVAASLWKIDDAATSELMKLFYQGMLGEKKLTPAAALRAAQVEMSRNKRWQAPFYWAAFVLQGEWR